MPDLAFKCTLLIAGLLLGTMASRVSGQARESATRPVSDLTLYFPLQETEPGREGAERLESYLRATGNPAFYLVQGFGCDTGGYAVSMKVAASRGDSLAASLRQSGVPARRVFVARAIVLSGTDRVRYRRAEVKLYESETAARAALALANARAERINDITRARLAADSGPSDRGDPDDTPGSAVDQATRASARTGLYWLLALLALVIIIAFLWIYTGRHVRNARHMLDSDDAEALEILTGGAVTPLPPTTQADDEAGTRPGRVTEFIRSARKQTMGAKKKSKAKITPISIRGAVDREFEDRSLSDLARSPIHALEGLTPRHARMLEEGFGIKTVEDLARLKYVEIARAIVVLSRYEK
jgi:hypothetical protein